MGQPAVPADARAPSWGWSLSTEGPGPRNTAGPPAGTEAELLPGSQGSGCGHPSDHGMRGALGGEKGIGKVKDMRWGGRPCRLINQAQDSHREKGLEGRLGPAS